MKTFLQVAAVGLVLTAIAALAVVPCLFIHNIWFVAIWMPSVMFAGTAALVGWAFWMDKKRGVAGVPGGLLMLAAVGSTI